MPNHESLSSDVVLGPRSLRISVHDESLTSDHVSAGLPVGRSVHDESLTSDHVSAGLALGRSVHDESLTSDVAAVVKVLSAQTRERLESIRESIKVQIEKPSSQEATATLRTEAPELAPFWDQLVHTPGSVPDWLVLLLMIISLLIQTFGKTHVVQQTTKIVKEQQIEIVIAPQPRNPQPEPDPPRASGH
jgi:hypothetical protein